MYRIVFICVALLVAATGCNTTIKQTNTEVTTDAAPLRPNARVYIAQPEDALDKHNAVPGSGRRTAIALESAFKLQTKNVVTGRAPETLEEALNHARDLSYEYVAIPTILKWQDRPTEWTGVRDKLQVKIDVVSVETGQVLRSSMIDAKGRWMTDGDDAPQDLLAEPVDKFVRSMFRVTYTPSALQR